MPLPAYNNGPKTLSLLRYAYRDGAKAQGGLRTVSCEYGRNGYRRSATVPGHAGTHAPTALQRCGSKTLSLLRYAYRDGVEDAVVLVA